MSITRSASPRRSRSSVALARRCRRRSGRRPAAGAGGGRDSKRRTSTSSEASRKTHPRVDAPGRRSSARRLAQVVEEARGRGRRRRPRSAARCPASGRRARPSAAISAGGRLSTTNQPRSSRHLAAVLRPAPDMPEMITSSGRLGPPRPASALVTARRPRSSCSLACLRRRRVRSPAVPRRPVVSMISPVAVFTAVRPGPPGEGRDDGLGRARGRCRAPRRSRSTVAARSRFSEPKCLQQRLRAGLAEAGHVVERRWRVIAWTACCAVVGDREPVGLVADPLQQVEALAGARQDHRVVVAGQPDLLQPLGQPAHGDVVDAELVQRPLRPPRPAARRRRRRRAAAGRRTCAGRPGRSASTPSGALGLVRADPLAGPLAPRGSGGTGG